MEDEKRRTITKRRALTVSAFIGSILLGVALLFGYNPKWNHGRDPAEPHHPNSKIDRQFDPKYIMLLYMDWEDSHGTIKDVLRVRAIKLQFRSTGWGNPANNTWENNQQQIAYWINYLNAGNIPPPLPDQMYVGHGLKDFNFNQPHHVVIYIQNTDVRYNPRYPVWFSDVLVNSATNPPEGAEKNYSFFAAQVKTPVDASNKPAIVGGYSTRVIYMKNFFRRRSWFGYPEITKPKSYSLKINALGRVTDLSGNLVDTSGQPWANILPFIIDPDTGNMGGGDPPR
jgi:hypothetical protein